MGERTLNYIQLDSGLTLDSITQLFIHLSVVSFARILIEYQAQDLSFPFFFLLCELTFPLILWEAKFNSEKENRGCICIL